MNPFIWARYLWVFCISIYAGLGRTYPELMISITPTVLPVFSLSYHFGEPVSFCIYTAAHAKHFVFTYMYQKLLQCFIIMLFSSIFFCCRFVCYIFIYNIEYIYGINGDMIEYVQYIMYITKLKPHFIWSVVIMFAFSWLNIGNWIRINMHIILHFVYYILPTYIMKYVDALVCGIHNCGFCCCEC